MKPLGNVKKIHSRCEHQNLNWFLLMFFFLKVIYEIIKILLFSFARIYLGNEMNSAMYFPVLQQTVFLSENPLKLSSWFM